MMKKRFAFIAVLLAFAASGAFAQRNTALLGVDAGVGFPAFAEGGVFAQYEFEIIPQLSVGASVGGQMYPLALFAVVFDNIMGGEDVIKSIFGPMVEGQVHWYPWAKKFHVDAGIGWSNYLSSMHTLLIAPGVGWRFDFGEPGGFVINVGLRAEIFVPLDASIMKDKDGETLLPVNFLSARLGFGYRF